MFCWCDMVKSGDSWALESSWTHASDFELGMRKSDHIVLCLVHSQSWWPELYCLCPSCHSAEATSMYQLTLFIFACVFCKTGCVYAWYESNTEPRVYLFLLPCFVMIHVSGKALVQLFSTESVRPQQANKRQLRHKLFKDDRNTDCVTLSEKYVCGVQADGNC